MGDTQFCVGEGTTELMLEEMDGWVGGWIYKQKDRQRETDGQTDLQRLAVYCTFV
jgi:hypothetical protein